MIDAMHADFQGWAPRRRGDRRPPRAFLDRWPTAADRRHKTELPPERRLYGGVVGRQARAEARRLMAAAWRARVNFGRSAKRKLREVARGERALSWAMWRNANDYLERTIAERRVCADLAARPYRVSLGPGGPQLHRRGPGA